MVKTTTHNIEISVDVKYFSQQSVPRDNHYFFIYFITIENKSDTSVQLLKRHWDIFDSCSETRTVEGDGVVGETPVIEPGEKFEYNSGCNLLTEIGYMSGFYTMQRMVDMQEFKVTIPKFEMIVPAKLN
ncbi:MAG: Co2+/Mg2+ efflux protein ApaG [Bacteroidetes bacterium]|nr:Co2+/Mg2+ efflux protein ApaG [Bacteroidota bacterium]